MSEEVLTHWGLSRLHPKKNFRSVTPCVLAEVYQLLEEPVASIIGMGTLNVAAACSAGVCGVASLSVLAPIVNLMIISNLSLC
jgi:hypothetical protein